MNSVAPIETVTCPTCSPVARFVNSGITYALANSFSDFLTGIDGSAGQHTNKLFAPKSSGEIGLPDCLSNALRNKPEDLISKLMTVLVVESFEVVYIDEKDAESFSMLHYPDLLGAQEGVKGTTVGKAGQRICVGVGLGFLKIGTELVQFDRCFGKSRLEGGRPLGRQGQFPNQMLQDELRGLSP